MPEDRIKPNVCRPSGENGPLQQGNTDRWCLVVLRNRDREVLLSRDSDCLRLPEVRIPSDERVPPNLLREVHRSLGLRASCRFNIPRRLEALPCVVLDGLDGSAKSDSGWLPIEELQSERIQPAAHRELFNAAIDRLRQYACEPLSANFVKSGWLDEVLAWTKDRLNISDRPLDVDWTQYGMGPDYSLLRFAWAGEAVWFKAVGGRNLREFFITNRIASLDLPHVPPVIAAREDWNAWLMAEAPGQPLNETTGSNEWCAAGRALAELQVASIPHGGELMDCGCQDLRVPSLLDGIERLLGSISLLMEQQTVTDRQRLTSSDLRFLESSLQASCRKLGAIAMPNTLGQSDLNSGNVLVASNGATFLDWALAHVGHPFFTFEYLIRLFERKSGRQRAVAPQMLRDYCNIWSDLCSRDHMDQALPLMPLLAAYAYAVTIASTQPPDVRDYHPRIAAVMRSLARRMYIEANILEQPAHPHCSDGACHVGHLTSSISDPNLG
jgi:hypothetical protein